MQKYRLRQYTSIGGHCTAFMGAAGPMSGPTENSENTAVQRRAEEAANTVNENPQLFKDKLNTGRKGKNNTQPQGVEQRNNVPPAGVRGLDDLISRRSPIGVEKNTDGSVTLSAGPNQEFRLGSGQPFDRSTTTHQRLRIASGCRIEYSVHAYDVYNSNGDIVADFRVVDKPIPQSPQVSESPEENGIHLYAGPENQDSNNSSERRKRAWNDLDKFGNRKK